MLLEEDCGIPHNISERSVNAKLAQNPWMAYLETPKGFHCSGTLINHCMFAYDILVVQI